MLCWRPCGVNLLCLHCYAGTSAGLPFILFCDAKIGAPLLMLLMLHNIQELYKKGMQQSSTARYYMLLLSTVKCRPRKIKGGFQCSLQDETLLPAEGATHNIQELYKRGL
jgi:hypothetical protein